MDDGDEVDESANPTMESRELVEGELGGVREGENREGSGFEGKEDAKREKREGDVSGSPGHGPPGLGDGVVGDISLDLFLVHRSVLKGRWGSRTVWNAGGSAGTDIVRTDEAEDHAEDEKENH